MSSDKFRFKAVLFDFDGTLTEPGALDFAGIREAVGCPPDPPILEFIEALQNQHQRQHATDILDEFEMEGAQKSVPNPDTEAIIRYLQSRNLPIGIISRNGRKPIIKAFERFHSIRPDDFDLIISRDDPVSPKPSPDGILFAAGKFAVKPEEILMVGDYSYDIQAGNRAGAATVLLSPPDRPLSFEADCDYKITHLRELKKIVRLGLPLPAGKFPGDLLSAFLEQLFFEDPSVLIAPGIGEDTAAVDIDGEEVLVLKSDPITFVSEGIGYYTVLINANDIATSGARPRWFLASLLFPTGVTPLAVLQVMNELKETCQKWAITLCGGHTEITNAVTRPVVTGMLAGTIEKSALIDKRQMQKGDQVLLTKRIAIEGTAIIVNELEKQLKELGIRSAEIQACKKFTSHISILNEAMIARKHDGITAMHDVTEGGLAAALFELSAAGNHKIRVEMDDIPIYEETEKICLALGIQPMGLIGSGSLLICCRKGTRKVLMNDLKTAGIEVTCIGEVLASGRGIDAFKNGSPTDWPVFEVDEITRVV